VVPAYRVKSVVSFVVSTFAGAGVGEVRVAAKCASNARSKFHDVFFNAACATASVAPVTARNSLIEDLCAAVVKFNEFRDLRRDEGLIHLDAAGGTEVGGAGDDDGAVGGLDAPAAWALDGEGVCLDDDT